MQSTAQVENHAPVVVCQDCGLSFSLLPNNLIGTNSSLGCYAIWLDQNQTFCLRCMQQYVLREMRQTQILQQRFIYQKEYESLQQHQKWPAFTNKITQQDNNLQEEIVMLQKEQKEMDSALEKLREESYDLKEKIFNFEVEEQKFWQGINKIERRTNKVEQKSTSTKFDKQFAKDHLEELSKMSMIHLFTNIVIDDNVAYIQGMPMGKKSQGTDVSWQEVAVGLGHLLITLNFLVVKYGYEYKLIEKIRFNGMHSQVTLKNKKKRLLILYPKQSQRMIGELLETLLIQTAQLSEHILEAEAIQYSQQFRIPFLINPLQCKIAELYIDPFKMDERLRWTSWTKVMRYFLIDFKHIITVYAINEKYL